MVSLINIEMEDVLKFDYGSQWKKHAKKAKRQSRIMVEGVKNAVKE